MSKRVPPTPLFRFDTDQGLRETLDAEPASQLVQGPANEGALSVTFLDSIVLGVVEGFTEFLPISSTGHLILASRLLGLPQTEFQKSFEITIQLGAIASVVILYWRKFLDIPVMSRVLTAFIPTGIIGFALYKIIKTYLFASEKIVLLALALGGVALIVFELLHWEPKDGVSDLGSISYPKAALVGVFQSVSVIPGISRAGATIVGGLILGLSRSTIVEFSFLLAVPTMLAATGYDLFKNASVFAPEQFGTLTAGFISSFIVAILSVKFLLAYIRTNTFIPFGVYRILVALVFGLFVL
jgi:undecaprenyl-diphosphatase